MLTYRISQTRYARLLTASGIYARWNYEGRQVIYTGGSAALSCLEISVHKTGASLHSGDFSITTFNIPKTLLIEEVLIKDLARKAKDWFTVANYPVTQGISERWLNLLSSAVLKVPSATIQNEFNYLLNVNHPDFHKIKIAGVSSSTFDPRLQTNHDAS
ncbi:MAG TPA: RES family NAD+ phosphorylase [Daejeonella sp.]|nr:RES family NAD+ phosphorylase [Daejeonella sp.]